MPLDHIANGDGGAETRAKLNEVIDGYNAIPDAVQAEFEANIGLFATITAPTWATLAAISGTYAGQPARCLAASGTHTDPVVGGTVSDRGEYAWSASPAGWRRVGDISTVDLAATDDRTSTDKATTPVGAVATVEERISTDPGNLPAGYAVGVVDDDLGTLPWGIDDDGVTRAREMVLGTLNGHPTGNVVRGALAAARYAGGKFAADIVYQGHLSQSLGQGSNRVQTVTQEYGALGFPARPGGVVPTSWVTLTNPNTMLPANGNEWIGPGMAAATWDLIEAETGLTRSDVSYTVLAANDCWGGTSIAQRSKAGTYGYADMQAHVQGAYNLAVAAGLTFKHLSTLIVDGETDANNNNTGSAYSTTLRQVAADIATDSKAKTGQAEDPVLIISQCATNQINLAGLKAGTLVGGSGGTNGTFALVLPAPGTQGVQATGTFTVAGGAVTGLALTNVGRGYAGEIALSNSAFAASAGLTGASAIIGLNASKMWIATAQAQAAKDDALIYLMGPRYQYRYFDYQHYDGISIRQHGALAGLVYKRTVIDGEPWVPLQPASAYRQGKVALVTFEGVDGGLTFDTTTVPAQTNMGFSLVDSGGGDLAIASVAIAGPRSVRIVASASIPAGAKVRYGFATMTGRTDTYVGGGGNLRDRQGDWAKHRTHRMDNWCVIFEQAL